MCILVNVTDSPFTSGPVACPSFFFPLPPLNELHWVEFRQSTPSCGPLVNVNPSSWELEGYLSSPAFFFLCAFVAKSLNDCIAVCLQAKRAVQRGATAVIFDVSENPDAIDQVGALLRNDTALTPTLPCYNNNIGTVGPSVNVAQVFFFLVGKKMHTLPF